MAANTNIQLTSVDFDALKNSLKTYLQGQSQFQDYNFEGSSLSVLLDLLVYNTQYNAYYLNMVGNEMFLDSSTQRSSAVSHAKLLNYTPRSSIAPTATVNITFNNVTEASLTLPAYSVFTSSAIDDVNYTFVNPTSYTVNTANNVASFTNVKIKQGVYGAFRFTVDSSANPNYVFEIPDASIDTTTLGVIVQESSSNSTYEIYNIETSFLTLDSTSKVFFLEEALTGNYSIRFGDGILGKKLKDGNIVFVTYVSTEGGLAEGANTFALMQSVGGYSATSVTSVLPATQGSDKESIESIKFQAPKAYSAQGRAVTKEDYITKIQQNNLGISFDAVSVWGGEQNDPPVYGKVFVSMKPTGGYNLTQIEKQKLISDVIRPISVMTVDPAIVDPDYTYLKLTVNVLYDAKKTTLTAGQIASAVRTAILNYSNTNLNTFNSTFSSPDLLVAINNADQSIITNELSVQLQKKFFPILGSTRNYKFFYGAPIKKNNFLSGISSSPSFRYISDIYGTVDNVLLEEVASATGGIETISIVNPGFGYQYPPKVTITGDGTGATATAEIDTTGAIKSLTITNAGSNYTSASVSFTPVSSDTTGQGAVGAVNLEGRNGTLRGYFFNAQSKKTIIIEEAGTVEYDKGLITLTDFNPLDVNDPLGQLVLTVEPTTTIVSSSFNRIISIDEFDPTAITVNVTAKT